MRYLVYCLVAAFPLVALGQQQAVDSLTQLLVHARADSTRGRLLCQLCESLRRAGQLDSALAVGERGLALLPAEESIPMRAACLSYLGNTHLVSGRLDEAEAAYRQGALQAQSARQPKIEAVNIMGLGNVAYYRGNFTLALKHHQQALQLYEAAQNLSGISQCLLNIGNVYEAMGKREEAVWHYEKSLSYKRKLKNSSGIANILSNLGLIYTDLKEYDRALAYAREALALRESIGERPGKVQSLVGIGNIYKHTQAYGKAEAAYREAYTLALELNDQPSALAALGNLGTVSYQLGRYAEARRISVQVLQGTTDLGLMVYRRETASTLYRIDSATGNWQSAFDYLRLFTVLKDSLVNEEKFREIGRLESQYEYERQAEIERVQAEVEAQHQRNRLRWVLGSAGGGMALLLVIAYTLFRGRQKEKRANAALRRLNAEIQQQKAEIEAQTTEIGAQRDQLDETNRRLVELDRMKEQLSGMLVHDLKNPLNVVLGLASLPPEPSRLLSIRQAGLQMSQLILNLLDIQKYEDAALVLNPQPVYVADLLQQATTQVEFLAEQRQITWSSEADRQLVVNADAELIVRVLVNLLTNAIKYAPAGDVLALEVAFDPARGAVFRLTDHGPGIPADQLDRIFDRFSQVDGGKASGKLRSTGLGLTFCRLTIEAHGGRIEAQSEVGRYTTFAFNLPQAHRSAYASEALPAAARTPEPGPLPPAFWADYQPIQAQLRATPFYLISEVMDRLAELPDAPDPWPAWKAAVEQAVFAGNVERFHELLA